MESERKERLEALARRISTLAESVGVSISRFGAGSHWEPVESYLRRLLLSLRLSDRVVCDCRARPHRERCRIFRYALQRAEAQELGVLPRPGDPI